MTRISLPEKTLPSRIAGSRMYTHSAIWRAIDMLGRRKGWSLPRLAEAAGLDPTALNGSKRVTRHGKPRWPSLETIAKLLSAVEIGFFAFATIVEDQSALPERDHREIVEGGCDR